MHLPGLPERAGFAYRYAAALAQGTIDCFDDTGAAVSSGATPMLPAGQHAHTGLPRVGAGPTTVAVAARQCLPQPLGRGRVAPAHDPGHDATTSPLHGQPGPNLVLFAAYKRPRLIGFGRLPPLLLCPFRPQLGQRQRGRQGFFWPASAASCARRPARARCCAGSCVRPKAWPPARTARPWRRMPAQIGPGVHPLCTGTWRAPGCYRWAEQVHCRRRHTNVASLPWVKTQQSF